MKKNRYWAFVLYLESAPEDWKDKLQLTGLPICLSPYHDKDLNPDGTPKKPHYHVILCFGGPTTFNNVKTITDSLNQPIPIPLQQVKGYYRYLTHMDNPEKAQYSEKDIQYLNGFNIDDYVDLTYSQVNTICVYLQQLVIDNTITEYADLLDYLLQHEMYTELEVARNHTILFNAYISSKRNKIKNEIKSQNIY
jgi:hypothetical protein